MVYRDHKRQLDCILVGITDYKHKSGSYLDFRYLDSSKYIRQSAAKALSRFEATGIVSDLDITDMSHLDTGTDYMPAKNITSQIENFIDAVIAPPKSNTKSVKKSRRKSSVSQNETVVPERYANVIYIDFIKKCRIY